MGPTERTWAVWVDRWSAVASGGARWPVGWSAAASGGQWAARGGARPARPAAPPDHLNQQQDQRELTGGQLWPAAVSEQHVQPPRQTT